MNIATAPDALRHPFLTGKPKRLFIDAKWVEAAPGKTAAAVCRVGRVNCYQAMNPAMPFGGYEMSSYGRDSGMQHVEGYLNVKAVWIRTV